MKAKIFISVFMLFFQGFYLFAQKQFMGLSPASKPDIFSDKILLRHEKTYGSSNANSLFADRGISLESDRGISLASDSPLVNITFKDTNYVAPEKFKTRMPQSLYIPGFLIAYGLTTMGNHGLYSSHQARKDLRSLTNGRGGPVDDILIFSPYVEFGALLLFKVQCRNDFTNTALLLVKSELLMLAILYPIKWMANEERPYSYQKGLDGEPLEQRKESAGAFESMPSGHTAEAFLAATIVHKEYRYLSPWYGIGAYTLATTVGVYRMINDQHWESDVLVGAGIGILSANIVYATHQHRWGRNAVCFTPTFDGNHKGLLFTYRF